MELVTPRLLLKLQTRAEVLDALEAMPVEMRAQVSPQWLARLHAASEGDPWAFAFRVVRRTDGTEVGNCAYKGPPVDGVVEISYATHPPHEGQGYATECAQALFDYAAGCEGVTRVIAHTLPDGAASQRVLAKCGFACSGDYVDPQDGLVTRFKRNA